LVAVMDLERDLLDLDGVVDLLVEVMVNFPAIEVPKIGLPEDSVPLSM